MHLQYPIACNATPPDIVITINGTTYPIGYENYIVPVSSAISNNDRYFCFTADPIEMFRPLATQKMDAFSVLRAFIMIMSNGHWATLSYAPIVTPTILRMRALDSARLNRWRQPHRLQQHRQHHRQRSPKYRMRSIISFSPLSR